MNIRTLFPLLVLIFLVFSCTQDNESITPKIQNISESVYASGIVKSKNQYDVFSKSNGIIQKIFVEEGMHVKKGEPLFQLDNKNSKIATENVRLASADADFFVNSDKLEEAENNIKLATKKFVNDSLLYVRQAKLWAQNIGSKVEFEKMEFNFQNSKVNLTNAEIRYDDLKRQLKLASDQSKNNLQIAELQEDDLIIRSEIDGVVYKIDKEEGELVNSLNPIAVIGTDEFIIELSIDEFDVVKIEPGQEVIIRMDSYQSQLFEALITTVDPMMNARTRSFTAEAEFTNKPAKLFPNLTAEANIVIRTKQDVLTIPRNYLINDSSVMLENGTLQKVEIGLMDYSLVEIISGLDKSTRINSPEK